FGDDTERYVIGSEEGYGFVSRLGELQSRQRAGKAVITVERAPIVPVRVVNPEADRLALATAEGRLLVFPIAELPEMAKGKGNKLVVLKGEDRIVAAAVVPPKTPLVFTCGKRVLTMKPSDVDSYVGGRASRGNFMPRGYRTVDRITVGGGG